MGAVLLPAVWAPWWGCWRVVKTRGTAPLLITDRFDVEKYIFLGRILASIAPTPVQWARPHARANNMRGCGRSEPAASRRWRTSAVAIPPPRWANAWYLPMRHTHSLIYYIRNCVRWHGQMHFSRIPSRAQSSFQSHRYPTIFPTQGSKIIPQRLLRAENSCGQIPKPTWANAICPPPFLHLPTPIFAFAHPQKYTKIMNFHHKRAR